MLVLSRKLGEQIMVGDDVVVTVVAMSGGRVRIGIEAPRSTPVYRSELQLAARPVGVQALACLLNTEQAQA